MSRRIDHVGIAVKSIEEGRRFYEALGLEVEEIEDVPQEGVRVAMIACGESRIELLEATREDSPIARFIDKRGPGLHHICLSTNDINGDDQRLREAGKRVLRPEPNGPMSCLLCSTIRATRISAATAARSRHLTSIGWHRKVCVSRIVMRRRRIVRPRALEC